MKALVFKETGELPALVDKSKPDKGENNVLLKVSHAALNHRDVWITKGLYPGVKQGVTLGSCCCGYIDDTEYIVNPNIEWGDNPEYPDHEHYRILGMPDDGCFAEYLSVPGHRLVEKPAHLSAAEAAALPLAGLTAYRALFIKAQCKTGDRVFISGVGGGVAMMAFQFALAAGAEVFVSSGSEYKRQKALDMGAVAAVDYKDEKWYKKFNEQHGLVDIVIDSAGGRGYDALLRVTAPQGRIVNYGGTMGNATFSPQQLFWKELSLLGSTMGNDAEFLAMTAFVSEHNISPVLDEVYPMEEYGKAFHRMDQGEQFGKIVLAMGH